MAAEDQNIDDVDEPLLSITTAVPKRPTVDIDGKLYELKRGDELGIVESQEFRADGAEFAKLWNKDRLTDGQKKRLNQLLARMFDAVTVKWPKSVADKLSDEAKQDVVVAFTSGPRRKLMARIAQMEQEAQIDSTMES